jgi:hypothetical protein
MMAKVLWFVVALFLMCVPAQAQCTDLGQPAQQVVFNIVFGDCFRTFKLGEPA